MNSTLRDCLLSAVLIAVPAGGFALAEQYVVPASAAQAGPQKGLGDLSTYEAILADTQRIASGGDLAAAEVRITDLERLWDDNAADLRKADRAAWTAVDSAADEAFAALRARTPDPAEVAQALAKLQATLAAPTPAGARAPVGYVAGIAVTDESGHPLPCEEMIAALRSALAGAPPTAAVADLQSKALERCNADDDTRADAFAAEALSQIKG